MNHLKKIISTELENHQEILKKVISEIQDDILQASQVVIKTLKNHHKILLFGNGGSAADAQHLAAEFVGRYKTERQGLPAIALTTDTSILTAISNDYGYEKVFQRQIESLAQKGDLLIGISTSGNSPNVVAGLIKGRELGCTCLGFTGIKGGAMQNICDILLKIPSEDTARIQEMHILIGHILCEATDQAFLN